MKNVGLPIIVVIVVVAIATFYSAEDEINEVYNSQLITSANILLIMNHDKDSTPDEISMKLENTYLEDTDRKKLDEYAKWRAFRVWKRGGLVVYSDNAQPNTVPPYSRGFTDVTLGDEPWRLFTLYAPEEQIIVEVAENGEARTEIIMNIIFSLILPLLISLPLIVFLLWKGIRWGLRDLRHFANTLKTRSPGDLSQLVGDNTPVEIKPLADSINILLWKLHSSIAQERLFTDNAAHELRTPLAALGIQADVVLHSKDDAERENAVLELAKGVRRASRMLDQLLTMARIHQEPLEPKPLNLYEQAREAIKMVYAKAFEKHIELSLSGDEKAEVTSIHALWMTLLTNLLDNAIKYTPAGGEVHIHISKQCGVPLVVIEDTGPGIPQEEYENVFKRFYRIKGNQETGSGLGLAIVSSIAELLHVRVNFYHPIKVTGLGVKLMFTQPEII